MKILERKNILYKKMSKKTRKVPVSLHPQDSGPLSSEEIMIILRRADDLIMKGGRNLLAKDPGIRKYWH